MFGNSLADLRDQLGKTQDEFASDIGASQGMVSAWERGEKYPRPEYLLAISERYGVDLFGRSGEETDRAEAARRPPPRAPGDRERLIQWLEWLTEILRYDLLPGLVWEGGGGGGKEDGADLGPPPVARGRAQRMEEEETDEAS